MENYTPKTTAELHLRVICTTLSSHGFKTKGLDKTEEKELRNLIGKYAESVDI